MTRRADLADRTRADLLAAAKRLFAERGYLGTKITDITAEAGRAVGSFYTHFSDKEELLAVLRTEVDEAVIRHRESLGGPGPAGHDAVREHVTACWTAMRTNRSAVVALVQSAIAAAPASGRFRQELAARTTSLRTQLEDLRDRGEPLPGDPQLIAAAVGVMLAGLNHALPVAGAPEDGRITDAITDLVLYGVTGPRTGVLSGENRAPR